MLNNYVCLITGMFTCALAIFYQKLWQSIDTSLWVSNLFYKRPEEQRKETKYFKKDHGTVNKPLEQQFCKLMAITFACCVK